jgi:hypothetical protein
MNVGDWVLYEATHQNTKEQRMGKVRGVNTDVIDVTWYWIKPPSNQVVFASSVVLRAYCTPITKEVADVIIFSNNDKE